MSTIELRNVTKKFGAFVAVKDVDLSVAAGEVVSRPESVVKELLAAKAIRRTHGKCSEEKKEGRNHGIHGIHGKKTEETRKRE